MAQCASYAIAAGVPLITAVVVVVGNKHLCVTADVTGFLPGPLMAGSASLAAPLLSAGNGALRYTIPVGPLDPAAVVTQDLGVGYFV